MNIPQLFEHPSKFASGIVRAMDELLIKMDEAGVPANIGAHVDLAVNQLCSHYRLSREVTAALASDFEPFGPDTLINEWAKSEQIIKGVDIS